MLFFFFFAHHLTYLRFQVLTEMRMKMPVAPCILIETDRSFRGDIVRNLMIAALSTSETSVPEDSRLNLILTIHFSVRLLPHQHHQ
jgi:hypothetical protein